MFKDRPKAGRKAQPLSRAAAVERLSKTVPLLISLPFEA
jgi:hypothetical protein